FLQGPRLLPFLHHAPHAGDRDAPLGPRSSARAYAPVGAVAAALGALFSPETRSSSRARSTLPCARSSASSVAGRGGPEHERRGRARSPSFNDSAAPSTSTCTFIA